MDYLDRPCRSLKEYLKEVAEREIKSVKKTQTKEEVVKPVILEN